MDRMRNSLIRDVVIIAVISMSLGCNSDGPTQSKTAVLSVDISSLNFSQMLKVSSIIIANAGEGELKWNISSKPEWLGVSKISGSVTNNADTVITTAHISQPLGNYSGKIIINSNGGTHEIATTLSIRFRIEVFPGMGAAKLTLNETYSEIIQEHGFSDTFTTVFDSSGAIVGHIVDYLAEGLSFFLEGNGLTPEQTDTIKRIILESPYDGVTDKFIGIGSSVTEVQNAYGEPDTINTITNLDGYSIGINFFYNPADTSVIKMEIF